MAGRPRRNATPAEVAHVELWRSRGYGRPLIVRKTGLPDRLVRRVLGRTGQEDWGDRDLRYVRQQCWQCSVQQMADKLGRTEKAIREKLSEFGISLVEERLAMSATYAGDLIGRDTGVILRAISKGELAARRPEGETVWRIFPEDLRAYLLANLERADPAKAARASKRWPQGLWHELGGLLGDLWGRSHDGKQEKARKLREARHEG